MNIVVGRSSDDDYPSLSSCSSLGENLDQFSNVIYKQKKFRVIDFKPYKILTTVNLGSIWRLKSVKWKKQTKMRPLLDWVTWIGKICFWTNKCRLCLFDSCLSISFDMSMETKVSGGLSYLPDYLSLICFPSMMNYWEEIFLLH